MLFLLLLSLLTGCVAGRQSAVLWTDIPELALAVELFNSTQPEYRIEMRYREQPALDLLRKSKMPSREAPSLVIGSYLLSDSVVRQLRPLDDLFSRYFVDPNDYHPALLEAGRRGTRQMLLPVTFDCIVIIQRNSASSESGTGIVEWDDLLKEAAAENVKDAKGEYLAMGFSPRWSSDLLAALPLAAGASFTENARWKPTSIQEIPVDYAASLQSPSGVDTSGASAAAGEKISVPGTAAGFLPFLWKQGSLGTSVLEAARWSKEANGSVGLENAFLYRFGTRPGYRLVLDGLAKFWPMKASTFFGLPVDVRSRLEYRYLVKDGACVLLPDVRYAALPARAPNQKAAYAFLRWLSSPDILQQLNAFMQESGIAAGRFGIFGGFPALVAFTGRNMKSMFPDYAKNPLQAELVPQPSRLPPFWGEVSREFVEPWMAEMLDGKAITLDASAIEAAFTRAAIRYLATLPDWLEAFSMQANGAAQNR